MAWRSPVNDQLAGGVLGVCCDAEGVEADCGPEQVGGEVGGDAAMDDCGDVIAGEDDCRLYQPGRVFDASGILSHHDLVESHGTLADAEETEAQKLVAVPAGGQPVTLEAC